MRYRTSQSTGRHVECDVVHATPFGRDEMGNVAVGGCRVAGVTLWTSPGRDVVRNVALGTGPGTQKGPPRVGWPFL